MNPVEYLDIVSYEQAKSLKELGFPQLQSCKWESSYLKHIKVIDYNMKYPDACAPTFDLVTSWLRKHKNIYIRVTPTSSKKWCYSLFTNGDGTFFASAESEMFNEYEDALSAGIDRAIEELKKNV